MARDALWYQNPLRASRTAPIAASARPARRRPVPGSPLVAGLAASAVGTLPIVEELKAERRCAPALESRAKRKDGLYQFRVKLPGN